MRHILRLALPLVAALGLSLGLAAPALACGGLVAPDGAVRLGRATTLVAFHDGIEHYLTSFTYEGDEQNVGWIVPLPTAPDAVQDGGAWTLQRLEREVQPPTNTFEAGASEASVAAPVSVILQTTVEALNITVIKGSGQGVVAWATGNGFALNDDIRSHLLIYAQASPYFMAAKFDTSKLHQRHEIQGDGTPLLITMHLAHPWVPLEVLALDGQQVQADLFFLTDMPLNTSDFAATVGQSPLSEPVGNATGFTVAFQEPMNASLYHDLSTDRNMGWVRSDGWLTELSLDAPAEQVTYDLGITDRGVIRLAPFGTAPMSIGGSDSTPTWLPRLPIGTPQVVVIVLLIATLIAVIVVLGRPRHAHERIPPADAV
jgi:hypothetical protein